MAETMAGDLDLKDPPFPLTAVDRQVLATKDEDFHRYTWDDLRDIIGTDSHVVGSLRKNS